MGRITINELSEELVEHLNTLGLTEEQVQELIDNMVTEDIGNKEELATTDKTIVGAINELFQNANNGKTIIADAIGEPLSAEDTFAAMGSNINQLISNFKNQLAVKGITSNNAEKFQELIQKIATINQEVGMQITTGVATLETGGKNFNLVSGGTRGCSYFKIKNLPFKPSLIVDFCKVSYNDCISVFSYNDNQLYSPAVKYTYFTDGYSESASGNIKGDNLVMLDDYNYDIPVFAGVEGHSWIAIGQIEDPKPAQSITPSTSNQVLPSGYYTGDITVNGDADLVPENILEGKEIFGVSGNISNMGEYTASNDYVANSGTQLHIGIPNGAYLTNTSSGCPEIQIDNSKLNLYPNNIVSGVTVGGITGTAGGNSGSGTYTIPPESEGYTGTITIPTNLGFTPSLFFVNMQINKYSYDPPTSVPTNFTLSTVNNSYGVYFRWTDGGISSGPTISLSYTANDFTINFSKNANSMCHLLPDSVITWCAIK